MSNPEERPPLLEIVRNTGAHEPEATLSEFRLFLEGHSCTECQETGSSAGPARAAKNQDTYLTWDHMDVYFATSMRKAWEYMDLYDFIERLVSADEFKDLDLRYFDPTQAYTDNRINKGLGGSVNAEACSLHGLFGAGHRHAGQRLGTGFTLAQGKPVIAYLPGVDVNQRTGQLAAEDPVTVLERLRFVLYADEQLAQRLNDEEYGLVIASRMIWLITARSGSGCRSPTRTQPGSCEKTSGRTWSVFAGSLRV